MINPKIIERIETNDPFPSFSPPPIILFKLASRLMESAEQQLEA